jgi:hypothetical protein
MTWHSVAVLLVLVVGVAATILMFATTLLFVLQAPIQTVPGCPDGSDLYTRTAVYGKVALPVQHCFREGDARDMQSAF